MSAGPAFYGHVTGDYERFKPLIDSLSLSRGTWYSAIDIQAILWQEYLNKTVESTSISAFPSLHVSMATLYFLASLRLGKIPSIASLMFLLTTLVGSVYLGWHYAVDGYCSIVVTIAIWKVVGLFSISNRAQLTFISSLSKSKSILSTRI